MKKWKKIQKSLIKKWNNKLCEWFGHKPVTVMEEAKERSLGDWDLSEVFEMW